MNKVIICNMETIYETHKNNCVHQLMQLDTICINRILTAFFKTR